MKKILILISILVSLTGGTVFYLQQKQEKPKLEQVNVDEKIAEEKVAEELKSEENKVTESETKPEQKVDEQKEAKKEVKSDPKPENNNVSSASKTEVKQENKQNNSVSKEIPKETPKEAPKPKENNTTPSQKPSSQPQNGGATTKLYDSITGGKKEFATDSEANARGAEIKSKELDYVLDYNEQHPEAPIKPDIRYYRVYPVIDDEGTGYYLHFFCESGEGNDAKLKSMY